MPNREFTHPLYIKAEQLFQQKQNKPSLRLLLQLSAQKNLPLALQQQVSNRLFAVYTRLGKIVESCLHAENSLQLAKRLKDQQLIAKAYDNTANAYMQLSRPADAIVCLQKSLLIKEKEGNLKDMSNSLLQLSGLHFKIGNTTDGKKMLEQAEANIKKYRQTEFYTPLYFAKAMQLSNEKKHTLCITQYALAIKYATQQNDHLMMCRTLHNKAEAHITLNEWKPANHCLLQALDLVKKHEIQIDKLTLQTLLAKVSLSLKNYKQCGKYLSKVNRLAAKNKNPMLQQMLHQVSAQYYQATKNYTQATKHYQAYINCYTHNYNSELSNRITQLQTQFETEKRERLLKEEQLRRTETELNLMRTQMNPHFIYNVINTIRYFVNHSPITDADKLLHDFSTMMRAVLDSSRENIVTLEKNLEILKLYLQFEQLRKKLPFTYHIHISPNIKPSVTKIPGLLIQPLLENAIHHGFFTKTDGPGNIELHLTKSKNTFTVTVTDNGIGRSKAATLKRLSDHHSHATDIIRQTLRLLWKTEDVSEYLQYTDLYHPNGQAAGTKVTVTFPL